MRRRTARVLLPGAALVGAVALAACGSSAPTPTTTTTTPPVPTSVAFVTTIGAGNNLGLGNSVVALNLTDESVAPVSISTGTFPAAVAVSETLHTVYVANYASNTITPIDLYTGRAGKAISAGSGPAGIAITPDGKTAYVADAGSNPIGDTVTPIDLVTKKALAPITVGAGPEGIAITPDGKMAYVADTGAVVAGQTGSIGDTVTPINLTTNTALHPITVGNAPEAVAISSDSTTAYVANANSQSVSPISVATNTAGTPIGVKGNPQALAVTPDGATVWVANQLGKTGNLQPIDISTATAGAATTLGVAPTGLADSSGFLDVADYGANAVDVVSLTGATPTIVHHFSVPGGPYAIALASLPADKVPKELRATVAKSSGKTKKKSSGL